MEEKQTLDAVCYLLIKICNNENMEKMTLTYNGVTYQELLLGDWEITVARKKKYEVS